METEHQHETPETPWSGPSPMFSYGWNSSNLPHAFIGTLHLFIFSLFFSFSFFLQWHLSDAAGIQGGSFYIYGVYLLYAYVCNRVQHWKDCIEIPFVVVFGILQSIGPIYIFAVYHSCSDKAIAGAPESEGCSRTTMHLLAALGTVGGAASAFVLRKLVVPLHEPGRRRPRFVDFGIPVTGFMSGYFIYNHDHKSAGPWLMSVAMLHKSSAICMMLFSALRLVVDYHPDVLAVASFVMMLMGVFMFSAAPDFYTHALVSYKHIIELPLVFIFFIATFYLYVLMFYFLSRWNARRHARNHQYIPLVETHEGGRSHPSSKDSINSSNDNSVLDND